MADNLARKGWGFVPSFECHPPLSLIVEGMISVEQYGKLQAAIDDLAKSLNRRVEGEPA